MGYLRRHMPAPSSSIGLPRMVSGTMWTCRDAWRDGVEGMTHALVFMRFDNCA